MRHEMVASSEIDQAYKSTLNEFTSAAEKAINTSYASTGLQCGNSRYWASILFTRLCTFSISILSLCPDSQMNPKGLHWDFASIGTLTRNLFECALVFFYLGIEDVSEEEMKVRLMVMDLHDCTARARMSRDLVQENNASKKYEECKENLTKKLTEDAFFIKLPASVQKSVLKGQRSCIYSQDEILTRMGEDASWARGFYHFLSSHTHSLPVGFSRMAEHNRGHGGENDIEKCYVSAALDFCTNTLNRSTADMQKVFADIAHFKDKPFNWDALKKK